ncbi:MAG: class II fructose-bisphosphate aldolase [Verrucomicrobiota bacterium]
MPLVTEKSQVLELYREAARRHWVIPCFCTENLTTTEAVLAAVKDHGDRLGVANLPITIAITNCYPHRSQSVNYTHTRNWEVGLRLFLAELEVLTSGCSPYKDLRVMIHLDHVQHDLDRELLEWDMRRFSSIMYDASNLSLDDNIQATRRFVERCGRDIVIEGACDEIMDFGSGGSAMTTPADARQYLDGTGCDFIVANLGTEHRANVSDLQYRGDIARQIQAEIGTRLVLHGASSVDAGQIRQLFSDGVSKVNIWTVLERDSTDRLFKELVTHASGVVGEQQVRELQQQGLLGARVDAGHPKSIDYYTTLYRQGLVFEEMTRIVAGYLAIWYI